MNLSMTALLSQSLVDSHCLRGLNLAGFPLRRHLAEELVAALVTVFKLITWEAVEAGGAHVDLFRGELNTVHGPVLHGHIPVHGHVGRPIADAGLQYMPGEMGPEGGQALHLPGRLVELLWLLDDVRLAWRPRLEVLLHGAGALEGHRASNRRSEGLCCHIGLDVVLGVIRVTGGAQVHFSGGSHVLYGFLSRGFGDGPLLEAVSELCAALKGAARGSLGVFWPAALGDPPRQPLEVLLVRGEDLHRFTAWLVHLRWPGVPGLHCMGNVGLLVAGYPSEGSIRQLCLVGGPEALSQY